MDSPARASMPRLIKGTSPPAWFTASQQVVWGWIEEYQFLPAANLTISP